MTDGSREDAPLTTFGCALLPIRLALMVAMGAGVVYCLLLFAGQFVGPLREILGRWPNPLLPLLGPLRTFFKTQAGHIDFAPLAAAGAIILGRSILDALLTIAVPVRQSATPAPGQPAGEPPDAAAGKPGGRLPGPVPVGPRLSDKPYGNRGRQVLEHQAAIDAAMTRLKHARGEERNALRKQSAAAQEALSQHTRSVAFLAGDILQFSSMKPEESGQTRAQAVAAFRTWMEELLKQHGAETVAWTESSLLALFPRLDAALAAARAAICEIPRFNQEANSPFRARLGLSHGLAYVPPQAGLHDVQDDLLDLATSLAHSARSDSLLITRRDLAKIEGAAGFRLTQRRMAGDEVMEWCG